MSINEPAKEFFDVAFTKRYVLLNKQGPRATLSSPVSIGTYLLLDDNSTGLVLDKSNTILTSAKPTLSYATQLQDLTVQPFEVYSNNTGLLSIKCSTPSNHVKGFIGWSLFKDSVLLLRGNDLIKKNYLIVNELPPTSQKIWPLGIYQLDVTLFQSNLQATRTRSVEIQINKPQSIITSLSNNNNILELN